MTSHPRAGGAADVVYVFCLMQAAFVVLAGLGELLLMGSPAYLVLPVAKLVLLVVLATGVVSGRRSAAITLIAVQAVTLVGFWLQVAAGLLLPILNFTLNPVGLLTNVAMPIAVIWLCSSLLAPAAAGRGGRTGGTPAAAFVPAGGSSLTAGYQPAVNAAPVDPWAAAR